MSVNTNLKNIENQQHLSNQNKSDGRFTKTILLFRKL